MNGRVYDPEIGRFLSADPMVQFPDSTQGYDRYQYVNNNPLSATDPSGYFITLIVAAASSYGLATGSATMAQSFIATAIAGFVESGGSASVAFQAGLGAMMFGNLGSNVAAGAIGPVQAAITGALAGGALSKAGGGRFSDGFLGGMTGSILGPAGQLADGPMGALLAAAIGGTASEIGGGKLANGAISAAFAFAVAAGHEFNTRANDRAELTGGAKADERTVRGNLESAKARARSMLDKGCALATSYCADIGASVSDFDSVDIRFDRNKFFDGDGPDRSGGTAAYALKGRIVLFSGRLALSGGGLDVDQFASLLLHEYFHTTNAGVAASAKWKTEIVRLRSMGLSEAQILRAVPHAARPNELPANLFANTIYFLGNR